MKNFFLLFTAVLIFASCTKEPEANFEISKTTAYPGEEIYFTNSSTESESYEWDFGDGATSNHPNPSHSFADVGTYNVVLTAYSKKERKSNKITKVVNIEPCPQGFTGNGCTTQILPTKITITEIRIYKWPLLNSSGAGWDASDGPDLYFKYYGWLSTLLFESNNVTDAIPDFYYYWSPNIELSFFDYSSLNTIEVFDYDFSSNDDYLGGIEFEPYYDTNNFPESQYLTAGNFEIQLFYSYEW